VLAAGSVGQGEGRVVKPCYLGKPRWRSLTADADAPGSREVREHFCRYVLINQLYLYFLILL
jgi:hypothetical protein